MQRPRATLALAAVVCAAACATNPATGKKQLMLVSEAQELAMGRAADAEAVAAYGLYADAETQAYVDRIGQRLAAASERPGLPWSFKVVDDPAVNAFALPGASSTSRAASWRTSAPRRSLRASSGTRSGT